MNNDLISREALLKAMEEERQYLLARGQRGAEHILVHYCLPLIDNAPTVEQKESEEKNMKEMTVEQYRERMIEAFQNTGNDNLIALVCLPNEDSFKALESLLRNFWNKEGEVKMMNTEMLHELADEIKEKVNLLAELIKKYGVKGGEGE